MKSPYFEKPFEDFYLLNTDTTPNVRRHSPTLEDRGYIHSSNNVVESNRPVDIGYNYSVVGLSLRRPLYNAAEPPWNLPLSTRRIKTDEVRGTVTAEQVNELLAIEDTPLHNHLVVNALDSIMPRRNTLLIHTIMIIWSILFALPTIVLLGMS